jgi:Ca2+-binding EF-hand superfamily protein
MDDDKDEKVTKEEVKAFYKDRHHNDIDDAELEAMFDEVDVDGDGKLSKLEYLSIMGQGDLKSADSATLFGLIDTDGDGSVSVQEVSNFFNRFNTR